MRRRRSQASHTPCRGPGHPSRHRRRHRRPRRLRWRLVLPAAQQRALERHGERVDVLHVAPDRPGRLVDAAQSEWGHTRRFCTRPAGPPKHAGEASLPPSSAHLFGMYFSARW